MIKKLIRTVGDFIEKRKLSVDERAAYEAFKEAAKKDPSLKNKKITVRNFKEIEAEYQKVLKELEEEEKKAASGKVGDSKVLAEKVANFGKTAAKAPVTAVTAETAVRLAATSRELSKVMYNKLKNDEKLYQQLVDGIGEKEAKKLQKDLRSLSYGISIKRLKMKLNHTYSRSCEGALVSMVEDMKQIVNGVKDGDAAEIGKGVVKQQGTLKKIAGNKSLDTLDNDIKFAGKVAAKTFAKVKIDEFKDDRAKKKYDKKLEVAKQKAQKDIDKAKAKGKPVPKKALNPENYMKRKSSSNQSIIDSVLGTNDPDSKIGKKLRKVTGAMDDASKIKKILK